MESYRIITNVSNRLSASGSHGLIIECGSSPEDAVERATLRFGKKIDVFQVEDSNRNVVKVSGAHGELVDPQIWDCELF